MAIKASTGLRNYLLDTGALDTALAAGFIKIYDGTAPTSANDAIAGNLLVTISIDGLGTGINMAATASNGSIQKSGSEVWEGTIGVTGTATYYRHTEAADTGASSTTEKRIQGTIGVAGEDMNLSSTSLVATATQSIDYYVINLPTN